MALTAKITSASGEIGTWSDFRVNYEIEGMTDDMTLNSVTLYREGFTTQLNGRRRGEWSGSIEPYSSFSDFATEKFALRIAYTIAYKRYTADIQTDVSATLTIADEALNTVIELESFTVIDNKNIDLVDIEFYHYAKPGGRIANVSDSKTTVRYTLDGKDETELVYQSDKGVPYNRIILKDINRDSVAGKKFKMTYLKVENEVFPDFNPSIDSTSYDSIDTELNTILVDFSKITSITMPMYDMAYLNGARYDSIENMYIDSQYPMYVAETVPPRKKGETYNLTNASMYLLMYVAGENPTDNNVVEELGEVFNSNNYRGIDPEVIRVNLNLTPDNLLSNIEKYGKYYDIYWAYEDRDRNCTYIPYKKNIEIVEAEVIAFDKPIYEMQQIHAIKYNEGPQTVEIKLDESIPLEADFFISREMLYGSTPAAIVSREGNIWKISGLSYETDADLNISYATLQSWTKGKIYIQHESVEPNYVYGQMPYYEGDMTLKMDIKGDIKTGSNIEFDIMDPLQDRDMGNYSGLDGTPGPVVKLVKDGVMIFEVKENWDEHNYFEINDLTIANNGTYHSEVVYYTDADGLNIGPVLTVKSIPMVIKVEPLVDITASLKQTGDFVVGQKTTLTAKITSNPNTVQAVDWYKNGALLKHDGTNLNSELVIESATKEDIGIYVVTVTYLESQDEIQLDTNAIILAETGGPTLDVNVSITGPATVYEGETITLSSEVRVADKPEGTNIVYRWHFGKDGGLPINGASSDKLVISKADYLKNSGKYWCGVQVIAPDFPPVVKRSNELTVKVLRDPKLNIKASASKLEVEAGKTVELSFKHTATEGLKFTFDWYVNNVKIEGSHGQNPYVHTVTEDSAFYVKATPTEISRVIPDPVKSNVVIVRAVSESMKPDVLISGPTKAKLGQKVELLASIEPSELADQYQIKWMFKNEKVGSELLYKFTAATDNVGQYTVRAINKSNPDIIVEAHHTVELGDTPEVVPVIKIDMTKQVNYDVGDTIALVSFVTVTPKVGTTSYAWTKDGQPTLTDAPEMQIFRRENAQESDAGIYELAVTVSGEGVKTTSSKAKVYVGVGTNIPQPPSSNGVRYIHDLNPGRDRGYIWLGWWVHDEINDALIEGFDWRADPENERFKYKEDLKTLAYGLETWPDLEMQESRHGYILTKRDVTE